jgi:hypothetical protein
MSGIWHTWIGKYVDEIMMINMLYKFRSLQVESFMVDCLFILTF